VDHRRLLDRGDRLRPATVARHRAPRKRA
jgi:hypothetical protein